LCNKELLTYLLIRSGWTASKRTVLVCGQLYYAVTQRKQRLLETHTFTMWTAVIGNSELKLIIFIQQNGTKQIKEKKIQ